MVKLDNKEILAIYEIIILMEQMHDKKKESKSVLSPEC